MSEQDLRSSDSVMDVHVCVYIFVHLCVNSMYAICVLCRHVGMCACGFHFIYNMTSSSVKHCISISIAMVV